MMIFIQDPFLGMNEDNDERVVALFLKFNCGVNKDKCLEYKELVRIDDIETTKTMMTVVEVKNIIKIHNFEKDKRDDIIKELKNEGLLIRQIERLTGISFRVIRRI